jgi:predicted branched-subunit amino acid permease
MSATSVTPDIHETVAGPAAVDTGEVLAGRREVLAGARAMLPWLVGVVPYGLVIGVTIGASTVDTSAGLATGVTIYAGSAQIAAIDLLARGAGPAVVIAAVLAINARLIFYSGSIAPHWRGTSRTFRVLGSYLLVDPSYAVGKDGYLDRSERHGHLHYLGGAVTLWLAWQIAIVTGLVVGAGVPPELQLHYAVPLFLVAEVAHKAKTRPTIAAAAVGATIAVVGSDLPFHSGQLVGIVAGLAVALTVDRCSP